jgi:hypothetical protein
VGDKERHWWPPGTLATARSNLLKPLGPPDAWPVDLPPDNSLPNVQALLRRLGFVDCTDDKAIDPRTTVVVAIFLYDDRTPAHFAEQLANGKWLSKLGGGNDIEHRTTQSVEGGANGTLAHKMCRPRTSAADARHKAAVGQMLRAMTQRSG